MSGWAQRDAEEKEEMPVGSPEGRLSMDGDWIKPARLEMIRAFETGATRDTDTGKLDPEAFLSPLVIERYSQYLHKHRRQTDGTLRDGDNWQKGMPLSVYMKSAWRHFLAWWKLHRGFSDPADLEESICAVMFNSMGYLHVLLTNKLKDNADA